MVVYDLDGNKWVVNKDHIVAELEYKVYDQYRDRVLNIQKHYYMTGGLVIKTLLKPA